MAVGWPTKTTYANGDVYSASDVNDTNGTINLLGQSVAVAAGKNKIINGAAQVWQRGTTITTTGAYTADRFAEVNGVNSITYTRSTDVPSSLGFQYSISRAGTGSNMNQRIEAANAAQLAGQTVTLSFYYKSTAGADNLSISMYYANAADNFAALTQIGSIQVIASPATSWTRVSYTFTNISANAANGLSIYFYRGNGATSTTLMTGIQLEVGSTATAFQTATGNAGSELAACQRYYWRTGGSTSVERISLGMGYSTTRADFTVKLPVTMRVVPASIEYSTLAVDPTGGSVAITNLTIDSFTNSKDSAGLVATVASGLTQYRPYFLEATSTAGYLGLSAEL
jgi:hypothetical protein